MSSEWIGQGLETFLDVGSVEFVRHHLRPGPHDSRGRCGCYLGYCSVFPQRDRERANQIGVEYREKARATALYLAASALNQQMNGARRIDSEGSWPLASAAAADSKQVDIAPPRVGAAPRAHSTTLAEATQKREKLRNKKPLKKPQGVRRKMDSCRPHRFRHRRRTYGGWGLRGPFV